jgi:serine protease Do
MKMFLAIGTTLLAAGAILPGALAQVRVAPRPRVAATVSADSPYLGIGVQDIDSQRAAALKLKDVRGAEVTTVNENGPAAKAGIKDGDVVLEYNGEPVEGKDQLSRMVRETPVGRQVKVGLWRNGAIETVTVTIEARPGVRTFSGGDGGWSMPEFTMPDMRNFRMPEMEIPRFQMLYPTPLLGIQGEPLGSEQQLAEFFGVKDGVLVKSVNRSSAAEKAGIKAGDVIVKIDEARVNTTQEITNALRANRSKKNFTVTVVRNRKEIPLSVTIDQGAAPGAVHAHNYFLQLPADDRVI